MLTIPLETLGYIIEKAREFDVQVAPVDEDSGSNPSDDGESDVLQESEDNPAYDELVQAIDALDNGQKTEILALMWLGRGDASRDEWRSLVEQARDRRNEHETDYLTGTPLLSNYLEEGLAQLGYTPEQYEPATRV